jgi:hypothetical protein
VTALPKALTLLPVTPKPGPITAVRRSPLPETPGLPPGVAPWLAGRRRGLTPTEEQAEKGQGEVRTVEDGWSPRPLPPDFAHRARRALADLDRYLAPVPPEQEGRVLARVMTLLEHYAGRNRAPGVEEALADDWLEDVAEFPVWAIEEACRIWRRDPARSWRPTPGQFREICEDLVGEARVQRDRLRLVLAAKPAEPTAEELEAEMYRSRWRAHFGTIFNSSGTDR